MDGETVTRIIHMRTLHLGPEELLVAAKIAVRHDETAAEVAAAINAAENRIREACPIARVIYLEPDIYNALAAATGTNPGKDTEAPATAGGTGEGPASKESGH
ncbi:Putative transport protein OS=Streptomyces griseus subsp. griseus (strain JCM 4626 / NBRC) OX=455632 GN=SGR_4512 PE=4 SV=1 [Streptomyces griseus subsp. griseus]